MSSHPFNICFAGLGSVHQVPEQLAVSPSGDVEFAVVSESFHEDARWRGWLKVASVAALRGAVTITLPRDISAQTFGSILFVSLRRAGIYVDATFASSMFSLLSETVGAMFTVYVTNGDTLVGAIEDAYTEYVRQLEPLAA